MGPLMGMLDRLARRARAAAEADASARALVGFPQGSSRLVSVSGVHPPAGESSLPGVGGERC